VNSSRAKEVELTILLPCLNEEESVKSCVEAAHRGAASAGVASYEIVVADNGSIDHSASIASQAGARIVHVEKRGYGAALMAGISEARGRFVVMADADGSYDLEQIKAFMPGLRKGTALVMGSRFRGEIKPGAMPWLNRFVGNPSLTFIGNLLFRCGLTDFHSGMRGFDRSQILDLNLTTDGMEFASEMVIKATLAGLSRSEVPITLRPDMRSRPPHLRRWRDGWRHLRFMLLYSPRWLFMYPGLALMAVCLPMSIYLAFRPIEVGGLTLDVHTLLASVTGMAVGFQLAVLALFARLYASRAHLLPTAPTLERFAKAFSLEYGIGMGLVLVLFGIGLYLYGVVLWGERSFGPIIQYERTLRLVIAGSGCLLIGLQTLFSSFVLSLISDTSGENNLAPAPEPAHPTQ